MSACLGIDVGTSAAKVLALAADGSVLAKASRPYPTKAPALNWAEQSPEDWWQAVVAAIRDVVAQLGETPVVGIGLSGQLNGFVLVGEDNKPLHDAIIWLDQRAVKEATTLQRSLGNDIVALTGNPVSPIAVLPKLVWLKAHRAQLLAGARKLFFVKDYLLWRLTGVHATDPSDGSATNLMVLAERAWSHRLAVVAGISPGILPALSPSAAVVGKLGEEAAAATGLAAGTPVVPGGGDVAALATGCGIISDGILGVTLGTAGHVVLSAKTMPQGATGLWQLAHAVPDRVIWLGLIMTGGLSLAWLHRTIAAGRSSPSFEELVALADGVEAGARGVSFLPFLEGAATPYDRPDARGSFHGLTSSHGAGEMVQAVMEGVAFNIRQCVEQFQAFGAEIREVRLSEGGARVDRWCQIIADVLGRPVSLIDELDTSALGGAIMARAGVSGTPLAKVVRETVRIGRRFEPNSSNFGAYELAFGRYQDAAAAVLGLA
jgi:xylulokinase